MLIETLTPEEARVLGALAEKSLVTPDHYPLTLNSLRTACNQKSSRDPVTEYADETVSQALAGVHANGNLSLIQPTCMFRSVVRFKARPQTTPLLFAEALDQMLFFVCREIVHHERDFFRCRVFRLK